MIATMMMRGGLSVHDAMLGMLDALMAILYGLSAFVKWFSILIDAGVSERLW